MLHEHLKGVVEGLLSWQSDTKNSFKAKVSVATRISRRETCNLLRFGGKNLELSLSSDDYMSYIYINIWAYWA